MRRCLSRRFHGRQRYATIVFQTYFRGRLARLEKKRLKIEARQIGNIQGQKAKLEARVRELEEQLGQERHRREVAEQTVSSLQSQGVSTPAATRPSSHQPDVPPSPTPSPFPETPKESREGAVAPHPTPVVGAPTSSGGGAELAALQRKLANEAIERGKLKQQGDLFQKELHDQKLRLAMEIEKREQFQRANTLLKQQLEQAKSSGGGGAKGRGAEQATRQELVRVQVALRETTEQLENANARVGELEDKDRAVEEMLNQLTIQLVEERDSKQRHIDAARAHEETLALLKEDMAKKDTLLIEYMRREKLSELQEPDADWEVSFEGPKRGLKDFFFSSKKPSAEQCLKTLQLVLQDKMLENIRLRNELMNRGIHSPPVPRPDDAADGAVAAGGELKA